MHDFDPTELTVNCVSICWLYYSASRRSPLLVALADTVDTHNKHNHGYNENEATEYSTNHCHQSGRKIFFFFFCLRVFHIIII